MNTWSSLPIFPRFQNDVMDLCKCNRIIISSWCSRSSKAAHPPLKNSAVRYLTCGWSTHSISLQKWQSVISSSGEPRTSTCSHCFSASMSCASRSLYTTFPLLCTFCITYLHHEAGGKPAFWKVLRADSAGVHLALLAGSMELFHLLALRTEANGEHYRQIRFFSASSQ